MKNYLQYWTSRFIKDGLRQIKFVTGLGISFIVANEIHFILGLFTLIYVTVDYVLQNEKN